MVRWYSLSPFGSSHVHLNFPSAYCTLLFGVLPPADASRQLFLVLFLLVSFTLSRNTPSRPRSRLHSLVIAPFPLYIARLPWPLLFHLVTRRSWSTRSLAIRTLNRNNLSKGLRQEMLPLAADWRGAPRREIRSAQRDYNLFLKQTPRESQASP